jgi:hypothetical protein
VQGIGDDAFDDAFVALYIKSIGGLSVSGGALQNRPEI